MEKEKSRIIEEIGEKVKNCKKCPLWKTRTNPVIGAGNLDAELMFVGEAPGHNEDLLGRPFVGAAGKVLDELLGNIGLSRKDIYITNILKCRPPHNQDPNPDEIRACTPYLDKQIETIAPKTICTLGNFATKYVLTKFGFKSGSIGNVHGKVFHVKNLLIQTRIVPTYHPASVLYNPSVMDLLRKDFGNLR